LTQTLILKAAHFAAKKHRDQRRKDKHASPYIIHPISVALAITQIGGVDDPEILAAALLHDTLEDTATKPEELEAEFGKKVCEYVLDVSDDKTLPKDERKRRQIEHAKKISKGAALIKLGDKISNVTDVINSPPEDWDINRRKEYLDWAEKVIENCPKVNDRMENKFQEIIKQGREALI
jgi:guanosine-3',5'-bis(diphosphate) 3'-pyrophosphohydrolase